MEAHVHRHEHEDLPKRYSEHHHEHSHNHAYERVVREVYIPFKVRLLRAQIVDIEKELREAERKLGL